VGAVALVEEVVVELLLELPVPPAPAEPPEPDDASAAPEEPASVVVFWPRLSVR
jgi:hypothetical protein